MKRAPELRAGARAITSLQNDRVKLIRSLEMRKVRRDTGLFLAEGASVLIAARDAGWKPRMLVLLAEAATAGVHRDLRDWALASGAECLEVSAAVLGKIAARENPQTVLGVFDQRWLEAPAPDGIAVGLWVALEGIRDPGNLGTIVRTVDAVGGSGVLLVGNCVDPYAREAVRATMGSIFNVPLARMTMEECLALARRWRGDIAGTHLGASEDFRTRPYRAPTLLLMGAEGPGLSPELSAQCTRLVKIPMAGSLDSLNLAVATALMLYEIAKDRVRL